VATVLTRVIRIFVETSTCKRTLGAQRTSFGHTRNIVRHLRSLSVTPIDVAESVNNNWFDIHLLPWDSSANIFSHPRYVPTLVLSNSVRLDDDELVIQEVLDIQDIIVTDLVIFTTGSS
jgi:hypothetical protein